MDESVVLDGGCNTMLLVGPGVVLDYSEGWPDVKAVSWPARKEA